MSLRSSVISTARSSSASWLSAQRRGIRSHSRTYENVVREGSEGETNESARNRSHGGPNWNDFLLTSPRQVVDLLPWTSLNVLLIIRNIQLVQYLDSYVVGQERAKKVLSVAVFNHYNRSMS